MYLTDGEWIWSETFVKDAHKLLAVFAVDTFVNGDRSALEKYGSLSHVCWLPVWVNTFDTHGDYFKFNLDFGYLFLAMRYDPDAARRADYAHALSMLAYATGHHQNPYFQSIRLLSGEPTQSLREDALNGLKLYTRRGSIPIDNWNDPSVEKEGTLARYPIPVDRRNRQGFLDFLWKRSPFELQIGEGGLATVGIDYLLAYRLLREHQLEHAPASPTN